jgi:hypothetical protein
MNEKSKVYCDLTREEKQQKAINYLRDQAREVHYAGDGFLVNHLCAVALNHIKKWQKEKICAVSLPDYHWAITLALYWFVEDYMFYILEEVIKAAKPEKNDKKDLYKLIEITFNLMHACIDRDYDKIFSELEKIEFSWINEEHSCEDSALLSLTLELLWINNRSDERWESLVGHWIENTEGNCNKLLQSLKDRLTVQKAFYNPECLDASKKLLIKFDKNTQLFFNASIALLQCQWDEGRDAVNLLVPRYTFESVEALTLWYLRRAYSFRAKKNEPQDIGLKRRLVNISNIKLHSFNEHRKNWLQNKLAKLWKQEKAAGNSHSRFDAFRLADLMQITALRQWNVVDWQRALEYKAEAHLELSRHKFPENVHYAVEAIKLSVYYGQLQNDDRFLAALRLVEKASKKERESLTLYLLKTYPDQWYDVKKVFSQLTDTIPESCLPQLIKWSHVYLDSAPTFSSSEAAPMSFWGEIIKYSSAPKKLCNNLYDLALKAAKDPIVWSSDEKISDFLTQYLINAPIQKAIEISNHMLDTTTKHPHQNDGRWTILYNASLKRFDLADKIKDKLIKISEGVVQRHYINYITDSDLSKEPKDNPKLRQWCKDKIIADLKGATSGERNKIIFNYIPHMLIRQTKWHKEDLDILDIFFAVIQPEGPSDYYVYYSLASLDALCISGDTIFAEKISKKLPSWLKQLAKCSQRMSDPLSAFNINLPGQNGFDDLLAQLCVRMIEHDHAELFDEIADWIISNAS